MLNFYKINKKILLKILKKFATGQQFYEDDFHSIDHEW